ncbi:MAG: 16S rRNA (cytidine(1402)-2'-O)-methyltransferase [Thermoanaerobacterales bacterium]|nr:16S rRNA (cytidine(1402)-2'-O)-methyltransferase [Thermoanaerobacterales bacterium]
MDPGTLYLCATPIGNLEDITLRALRVLREVDLIAAEDTRRTRKLLAHYDIPTPLVSYHAHNRESRGKELLARLRDGRSIALVSDAGTPGVSDPGAALVARAVAEGVPVVAIPGASAALTALVVSGLPTARFAFEGFLPRKGRAKVLAELARETRTLVVFESPRRVVRTLEELLAVMGDRRVAVARELTKKFEEVFRGTLSEALAHFREREPRGEFTLVIEGAASGGAAEACGQQDLRAAVEELVASGADRREAVKEVARRYGVPRRNVYNLTMKNSFK